MSDNTNKIEYERPLRPQRSLPSFTRYSKFLAFVCFGTSLVFQRPIGDDFLKMLRMLHGILADDQAVFRFYLLFVSKRTTEDDEHLPIISEWRVKK